MGIEYADNRINTSSASFQAGKTAGVSNAKLHLVGSNPSVDDVQFTVNLSHIPGYKNFVYGTHIICVSVGENGSYLPECKIDTGGRWMGNSVNASYNSTTGILTVTKTIGYKGLIDNIAVYAVY